MKAERFRQIRNLFEAAMERDAEARNAFLRDACQGDEELLIEVGKLLAAQGQPTAWIDEGVLGPPLPRLEGSKIGPFEVLRQLGEGGMGAVYLASHDDAGIRRYVALKIVRPEVLSSEVLRRFKRERQILESLDHPNIARVLGGGSTQDGLPYLVMDYVDGKPIHTYCDEHRLDLAGRMKLFRDVCTAVQFAHEHQVVHRDLKPSNILVTADGTVKLLDFGIARIRESGPGAATCLTQSDLLLMTPEYASPEQVSGVSVTPASDVYSLGVVLYELLTGHRPYRLRSRMFREIVRVICEEAPERPSTAVVRPAEGGVSAAESIGRARNASMRDLQKDLSGNVDCILMKALEKDPSRRYPSARDFSEDLRLHGEGETAAARQYALLRATQKHAEQNAWWLTSVIAVTLAMYTKVIVMPPSVVFLVAGIGLVLVAGYYVGRWERGKEYARSTITSIVRMSPVIAIAMIAEFLFLRDLTVSPVVSLSLPWSFYLALILTAATGPAFFFYIWLQWRKRDRLGPVILALSSKRQRLGACIGLCLVVLYVIFALVDDGLREIAQITAMTAILLPCITLAFVVRPEIRQRGFVLFGIPQPWTSLLSFAWTAGRGRIEGKYDILRLRQRKLSPRIELYIPVGDREPIESLLKQQLMEWPT